jgi:hypothetical protein
MGEGGGGVRGEGGVNTPTASQRNIVKPVVSAKQATQASSKRRVRGKLSEKEIRENKISCHNIRGMFIKNLEHLPTVSVTREDGKQITPLGPIADLDLEIQCTAVQSVGSPGEPLCTRAGFKNITYRGKTDMRKAASPNQTPGGGPIFKEDEINTIGTMIERWEELENEEGGRKQKEEGRLSAGRRVSELSLSFERRGDLITEGEGGNHINQPGGGPSILKGQSNKIQPVNVKPRSSKNVKPSEEIFKLNAQSKSNFKIKIRNRSSSRPCS